MTQSVCANWVLPQRYSPEISVMEPVSNPPPMISSKALQPLVNFSRDWKRKKSRDRSRAHGGAKTSRKTYLTHGLALRSQHPADVLLTHKESRGMDDAIAHGLDTFPGLRTFFVVFFATSMIFSTLASLRPAHTRNNSFGREAHPGCPNVAFDEEKRLEVDTRKRNARNNAKSNRTLRGVIRT